MTCPPNAFRSGEAVIVLEPGETTTAGWGIQPTVAGRRAAGSAGEITSYERG